jgi:hypothetical protein
MFANGNANRKYKLKMSIKRRFNKLNVTDKMTTQDYMKELVLKKK